jgi:hypothetical protein
MASALAMVAWLSPQGSEEDLLTLVAGDPEAVTAIEYADNDAEVKVSRDGKAAVVEVLSKREPKKESQPAPSVAKSYPGTDKATALFKELVPLPAVRALGQAEESRLPTFGLDKPAASLRLRFGERSEELQIGNGTYGGSNVYVRSKDGQVYLVKSSIFSDLKAGGNSLIERQLLNVERESIARAAVRAGDKSRTLVQRERETRAKAYYADAAEPDKRLNQTTSFVDRVMRLRVVEPKAGKPSTPPALTVEIFGDDGSLGTISLWQPEGEIAVAESSKFKSPVTIAKVSAETLLKDLETVLTEK